MKNGKSEYFTMLAGRPKLSYTHCPVVSFGDCKALSLPDRLLSVVATLGSLVDYVVICDVKFSEFCSFMCRYL